MEISPQAFEPGRIWLVEYPIRYMGIRCNARMSLIRTAAGKVIVHSPAPLSPATRGFVDGLGPVSAILAPGTYHHLHAREWADAYPGAGLFICPGLARKVPALAAGTPIEDGRDYPWSTELAHLRTRGALWINEVAFFHRATGTLILTDLLENFTDDTPANWVTKVWLKWVFRMWNRPKPAPEYQLGWVDRRAARQALEHILAWDFRQIVLAHGELVREDAKAVARRAWSPPLG